MYENTKISKTSNHFLFNLVFNLNPMKLFFFTMLIMLTFQKINILDQKLIPKTIFHNLILLPCMTYENHKIEKI